MAHCSFRRVPVGRLAASSTFRPTTHYIVPIESRLPPADRIVPLKAGLSCKENVACGPIYQALGLDNIPSAYCHCIPVDILAAS